MQGSKALISFWVCLTTFSLTSLGSLLADLLAEGVIKTKTSNIEY